MRAIRVFLRTAFTDERLTWLLAHVRNGKLAYQSCCCLVGLTTADHSLQGRIPAAQIARASHYAMAKMFLGAREAEWAFFRLGIIRRPRPFSGDEARRRRLLPMITAELRRRARLRATVVPQQPASAASRRSPVAGLAAR